LTKSKQDTDQAPFPPSTSIIFASSLEADAIELSTESSEPTSTSAASSSTLVAPPSGQASMASLEQSLSQAHLAPLPAPIPMRHLDTQNLVDVIMHGPDEDVLSAHPPVVSGSSNSEPVNPQVPSPPLLYVNQPLFQLSPTLDGLSPRGGSPLTDISNSTVSVADTVAGSSEASHYMYANPMSRYMGTEQYIRKSYSVLWHLHHINMLY
jgi:hypothetical protein